MLKHTISISCSHEVVVEAVFSLAKPRKKLEVDLTHVNKSEKALLIIS